MKQKTVILFSSIFFILGILLVTPVHADFMPDDKKIIDSYIRFEGWETVEEYVIVQPYQEEWEKCETDMKFYLVNDGPTTDLGRWNKFSEYYNLHAIHRSDLSYISRAPEADIMTGNQIMIKGYKITCTSRAYLEAIGSQAKLPHSLGDMVDKNSDLIQMDYVATFKGIKNNVLQISVTKPTYRTNKADADAFIATLQPNRNTFDEEPAVSNVPINAPPITSKANSSTAESTNTPAWTIIAVVSVAIIGVGSTLLIKKKR